MPRSSIILALLISLLSSCAQTSPKTTADPNSIILEIIDQFPNGKGYEASPAAVTRLDQGLSLKNDKLTYQLDKIGPSFCSAATYLVFLETINRLREQGTLTLSPRDLATLTDADVKDGVKVFGRWNANGPGTARLFAELNCGRNFTSYDAARPGDFMKIWWTSEIGKKERGHLVVYLGRKANQISFWSSNQPKGYGVKTIPQERIKRVLFSRLDRPHHLSKINLLPQTDRYLQSMLSQSHTWKSVIEKCKVRTVPTP